MSKTRIFFITLCSVMFLIGTTNSLKKLPPDVRQDCQENESSSNLKKSVEEALESIKKESPQVHEDALRIWKNFKPTSKHHINYTYRSWGRRLILWLKDEKKMAFQTEQDVGEVFKILWRKGLISQDAVVLLMVDAWNYLVYLEGSPSWENRMEKRMENKAPQNRGTPNFSKRQKPKEQSV